ncbi:hypothetical protein LZG04_22450 [Saccharothrix sp. S26]|uniref:hypothetical protein n=1 Tax=Saccharothrix sp. S26 TaxID=2907215 RepID=UPI001F1B9A7B|nr:hypothetical protein [Saccharothrix sp. S26]MCE6997537.1 hypothetical protein [Saccharothrix sp. S26]
MTAPTDRDAPGKDQPDTVQRIGEALANVTVLTGLLVYFGWRRPDPHPTWTRALTFAVVSLSLFWSAGNYAEVRGVELARQYADDVSGRTAVVVYAGQRLHITAPGACEQPLADDGSRYRFRYPGLRLFGKVGAKYFLVSDGWTRERGTVVVLADTDDIRVELGHGPQPHSPTCV